MEYSKNQVDFIQKRILEIVKKLDTKDGTVFGPLMTMSEYITWVSHAQLAGYSVEQNTGRMYRDKENVRTVYTLG